MASLVRPDVELLVNAFAPPAPLKVLELGYCKGPNSKFFFHRGDTYTGIDRDQSNLRPVYLRYGTFLPGDFTQALPPGPFDLIFEQCTLCLNSDEQVRRMVQLVLGSLKPGGMFMSMDILTEGHPRLKGRPLRYFTLEGVRELFAPFEAIHLADTKALHRIDFIGRKRP